jgi:predicted HTH domain antitoxin
MMQQNLQLKLPMFVNIDMGELSFILAARLYENGKLSLGQAAKLAGVSKRTLMELLGNYGVSIFNYDANEIKGDFKNA